MMTNEERNEKRKKHFQIQSRYARGMHLRLGLLWEIPRCCIDQFVEEAVIGIHSALVRTNKHQKEIPPWVEYVPCDKCMKDI